MSRSLAKQLRNYSILLAGACLFCSAFLYVLLTGSATGSVATHYAAVASILTLLLVVGWVFFRLRVILLDPLALLALKGKELQVNKEFQEPVRVTGAHELPEEMHEVLACFNQLLRETHDRDMKLTARQNELARLRESVSVAREAKANFISNINHEIRTPLNAIIGFSSVIADQQFGAIDPRYVDFARDIKSSGEQLLSLLSDIISLSKAELGTLKLKMEQFNPVMVIDKCIQLEQAYANERNITIEFKADEKLPPMVADRVRFMQIVQHLLSNAIKYNRENGTVSITLSAEPANNHVHFYRLIVKDTGVGISKEKLDEIFVYFSPMERGFKQHAAGRGLGLPLVKKLVEVHNGSLNIDSLGEGTTITVRMISDPATLD